MWTETHYYKFPDAPTAAALTAPPEAALDVLGQIYNTSNPEAPVAIEGHHLNARWWGVEPAGWAAYQVPPPAHPKRNFA